MSAPLPKCLKNARRVLPTVSLVAAMVAVGLVTPPCRKILLWNATPSVPEGLYHITPLDAPRQGELVVTKLPSDAAKLANDRHYLPSNVPLIKPVAATPGQTVCRSNTEVAINGLIVGQALRRDSRGRQLPEWTGCITLRPDQIFVMNPDVADSFDGRYFGPIERGLVIGRATPIILLHARARTR